jgi:outer membrane protein TolC
MLVGVAEENLKALETHLADVTSRVKSGVSTRFDSLRVEVQIEEAKTEKIAADDAAAISRARLFEAIGIADDGKPLEGKMPDDFSKIDLSKAKLESIAREDRAAQVSEVEAMHDMSKASLAHWAPQVTLFGSQEWYNNINTSITEDDSRFKPDYLVGVMLSWNLFDGGASQASARQARLNEEAAKEKLAELDTSIPVGLDEAKRRLEYNVANYKAKLVSIRKAEESVRLARSGFRAGTRTNTEILDAVIDMNRVRASLVKSQVDAIDALGALELAVGSSLTGQL